MKATFRVRGKEYEAELARGEKGEGETFIPFRVVVRGQDSGLVEGTLRLTEKTLEVAGDRATREGGAADDLVVRACARSLASEVLIRKLKPGFSFIVDHRWVEPAAS